MYFELPKESDSSGEIIPVIDLFYRCLSKWYWFVLFLCISIFIAVLYIRMTPPMYTRTASLLIKEDSKGNASGEASALLGIGMWQPNTNLYNEMISLQSPAMITEVVKKLNLEMEYTTGSLLQKQILYGSDAPCTVQWIENEETVSFSFLIEILDAHSYKISNFVTEDKEGKSLFSCTGRWNDTLQTPCGKILINAAPGGGIEMPASVQVTKRNLYAVVNEYSSRLSVTLSNDKATVFDLSFRDAVVSRAEDFLNTLIAVYNENWIRDKNQIAKGTSQFINERLQVIERELAHVDNDISSFKSEHLLPDVQMASNLYLAQSNEADVQMWALSNQLYMAQYIHSYLRDPSSQDQLLPVNAGIENAAIEKQIAEYNTFHLQRNSLIANSSRLNPLVLDLDHMLEALRQSIRTSVESQIETLEGKMKAMQKRDSQTTEKLAANPTQAKDLLSIERQQKVKEALYLFLLQKREENELSQAFTAYNTQLIAAPYGSSHPTSPRKPMILLAALLAGLLAPALLIWLQENLNTTIQDRKDLGFLSIPFAGEIPMATQRKRFVRRKKDPEFIVVQEENRDAINEAFRVVRTNLDFLIQPARSGVVILSTSFNPGSGKTFVTLNLSLSMALKGKRVLVLDLDLRKASLSKYLDLPKVGISNYLAGQFTEWKHIIQKGFVHEKLDVIAAGVIPPNPSELLLDSRLRGLLSELKKEYDYIFLDCPPVEIVADTTIVSPLADTTLFIVRHGLMDRRMLPEIEEFKKKQKLKGMAILLNGTDTLYRKNYGYRYGY